MCNKAKVQAFIRTLSDEEINSQIGDLFAFMEEYKQLLIEEQALRRHNNSMGYNEQPINRDIPTAIKSQSGDTQEIYTETSLLQLLDGVRKSKETFKKCSVPTKYEMIDNNAFENVKEIDYLILSDNISVIGNSAFSCAVIHQLRIPSSVKKVASNAFKGITGVIECEANSYICNAAKHSIQNYKLNC